MVVVRLDADLAGEWLPHWELSAGLEQARHYDNVPSRGRFGRRGGSGCPAQAARLGRQGLGSAAVAEHDVVSGVYPPPGHSAANVAGPDEPDGGQAGLNDDVARRTYDPGEGRGRAPQQLR